MKSPPVAFLLLPFCLLSVFGIPFVVDIDSQFYLKIIFIILLKILTQIILFKIHIHILLIPKINLLFCCSCIVCCRFFAFTTAEIGVRTILLPIPTNKGLPRFCCDGLNTAAVLNRLIGLCRLFGVVKIGLNEAEVIFGGIVGIFPFNLFGFSLIPSSFPVSMAFSFPIPSFSG
jgi:hypothetical protein